MTRSSATPCQPRALLTMGGLLGAAMALMPGLAAAQQAQTFTHPQAEVRLILHDTLAQEDRAMLEVIAASPEIVASMLDIASGHAALALAPGEGMMGDGTPPASATALGGLPDAATARAEALRMCEAARRSGPACVVVMEVSPRG
ncbi:MAG: hypothetical protein ACXIUV_06850 [Alkalilacustris sp.]